MAVAVEPLHAVGRGVVTARGAEVEAAAEERAAAGEDERANGVVGACRGERGVEVAEERLLERVCRRAIEREDADAAGAVVRADGAAQGMTSGGNMKLGFACATTDSLRWRIASSMSG